MGLKINIRGKSWTFKRTKRGLGKTKEHPGGLWGVCDFDKREIRVLPEDQFPSGEKELDVLIHETLHALYPDLAEESVTEGATVLAKVLVQAGIVPGSGDK